MFYNYIVYVGQLNKREYFIFLKEFVVFVNKSAFHFRRK